MHEFYNPSNGHEVVVINWKVFLGWIVWIGYAVVSSKILSEKWLKRGYKKE